jgi:antibiotic biosynthesis monooxygenase (ABM) superfamily enzyme
LETWFTLPGHAVVVPPPNYKMAAIVLTALYPILIGVLPLLDLIASSIGEPFLAAPVTVGPEFAVGTLVATLVVVPLMTWIAMPLLTMLAGRWLYPRS